MLKILIILLSFLFSSNVFAELPKCKNSFNNCIGKIKFNGGSYEGEFQNNKANGSGVMKLKNFQYTGDFINNKFEGKGKAIWFNNKKIKSYEGEWSNNLMNGVGKLELMSGTFYFGQFKNGKMDGEGKLVSNDKSVIKEGIWKNNEFFKQQKTNAFVVSKEERIKEKERLAKLRNNEQNRKDFYKHLQETKPRLDSDTDEIVTNGEKSSTDRNVFNVVTLKELEEKKQLQKISSTSQNKSTRSIYGFAFNDNVYDIDFKKRKCDKYGFPNFLVCKYDDENIRIWFNQGDGFAYMIERPLGNYSASGFSNIKSNLEKKYEVIASPNIEEIEKFASINSSSELSFYYENKKEKEKPLYILFSASRGGPLAVPKLTIKYYSKEYFEKKVFKKLKKRKNKYKDL